MRARGLSLLFEMALLLGAWRALSCHGDVVLASAGNGYEMGYAGLNELQKSGRDTWYFWTGGDRDAAGEVVGDQALWRSLAVRSHGTMDLLQALDSRMRGERFAKFGVMNDPGCVPAKAADRYGLWLDDCSASSDPRLKDTGEPTGVIGLRRFLNPKFDPARWDVEKYKADPATVEPPYLVGMACAFCHVGLNPQHPPVDPEHPLWSNLHAGVGNQYLREQMFHTAKYPAKRGLTDKDFLWQAAHAEPPGTAETSEVATDHINNPGTINGIAALNSRPLHMEVTADGVSREVFTVLKDGADSVGAGCLEDPSEHPGVNDMACAAMRGYINIGVCAEYWLSLQDPVMGMARKQRPFIPAEARKANKACDASWNATAARVGGVEAFLRSLQPLPLSDAEGGAAHLSSDQSVMRRGKIAFADYCARCHSSKRPPQGFSGDEKQWFRVAVLKGDFLVGNYLSDDARHPVTEIGTNMERAMASNAMRGNIWEAFSSETYKNLPPVHVTGVPNPLGPMLPKLSIEATGGRGYYRTPSLLNVWATAPFFHNNALGSFSGDPSVAGRLAAYEDAMEKLLWPEKRSGRRSILRTTRISVFHFPEGGELCVARGTPIDLVTNVRGTPPGWMSRPTLISKALCPVTATGAVNAFFLRNDTVPDVVQDRGHTFGAEMSDEDKRALIEFVKTF